MKESVCYARKNITMEQYEVLPEDVRADVFDGIVYKYVQSVRSSSDNP
jgi:hypothetical protein